MKKALVLGYLGIGTVLAATAVIDYAEENEVSAEDAVFVTAVLAPFAVPIGIKNLCKRKIEKLNKKNTNKAYE